MYKQRFYIIVLLFIHYTGLLAQDNPANRNLMVEEIICSSSNYEFKIGDNYYKEGRRSKAYICPKDLPGEIIVVNAVNHIPLTILPITWSTNLNQIIAPSQAYAGIPNFSGNTLNITCSFTDSTGSVKLRLKIKRNIAVNFSISSNSDYVFDENKITKYWPSATIPAKMPWKYLKSMIVDPVKIETIPNNKAYKAPKLIPSAVVSVNPTKLNASIQEIDIETTYTNYITGDINACAAYSELHLLGSNGMTVEIEIFQLCETDDDVQVNSGVVSSATDVCVAPGPDGSLDEEIAASFSTFNPSISTSWIDTLDEIVKNPNDDKWYVIAGPDNICQTDVKPPDTLCPSSPVDLVKLELLINKAKTIYKEIGVDINNITTTVNNLYVNYDLYFDDGLMDSEQELPHLHNKLFLNSVPDVTQIWLVDEFKKNGLPGATSRFGKNSFAIVVDLARVTTLAHELGHARFGLRHPHKSNPITGRVADPKFLKDKLGIYNEEYNYNDTKNIMSYDNTSTKNLFRAYQWRIIYDSNFSNSLK